VDFTTNIAESDFRYTQVGAAITVEAMILSPELTAACVSANC
jgi:hypothetical protein